MRRSRTAPTPVTDLSTLAVLREHPVHPMHPLLRTSSDQHRVSFTGIPMRTTRKTKEAASNEEGEPYSRIEHLRHIGSTNLVDTKDEPMASGWAVTLVSLYL